MEEAAEELELPASLRDEFACREYYGTVSHNVKAVYQRYLGWFDGNPAHLHPHPPVEAARRYVDYMGGAEAVLARARESFDEGDYRWVAEVVNHVVFADPGNRRGARAAGRRARAARLPGRVGPLARPSTSPARSSCARAWRPGARWPTRRTWTCSRALTAEMVLHVVGVRIDGPRADGTRDRARRGVHRRGRVLRAHGRARGAQPPARPARPTRRPRCARRGSRSWPLVGGVVTRRRRARRRRDRDRGRRGGARRAARAARGAARALPDRHALIGLTER